MFLKQRKWHVVALMTVVLGMLAIIMVLTAPGATLAQDPTDEPADQPQATEEPADGEGDDSGLPLNPRSDDILERGAYLVRVEIACAGCHGAEGYKEDIINIPLSGGREFQLPGLGTVYAPNLTTLQDWSAQDIENAIRYGVGPEGTVLLPPMSYHLHEAIADPDMDAIVAYIQSLEPVENDVPEAELSEGLTREMVRPVPEFDEEMEYPYPEGMDEDPLVRGTYLAQHTSHCLACHGSVDENGVVIVDGPAAGEAVPMFPALLQEDLEGYSDDDLRAILQDTGLLEMPTYAYQYMVPEDVDALIAWLRSQPSREELESGEDTEE